MGFHLAPVAAEAEKYLLTRFLFGERETWGIVAEEYCSLEWQMTTLADRSPVSWDWTHPTNLFWRSQRSVHEKERVERRCGEEEWDEGEEGR